MRSYRIAVFSSAPDAGNHCFVYLLNKALNTSEMQSIAASRGLSETAFISLQTNWAELRIFSPLREMASCLHATLAACYVLQLEAPSYDLYFNNELLAPIYVDGQLAIGIPLLPKEATAKAVALRLRPPFAAALSLWGVTTASRKRRLMIEYADEKSVQTIEACSFTDLAQTFPEIESFFVYARTDEPNTYTGRMFAPQLGIAEDPVNGNSCIALASILSAQANDLDFLKVRQAQQCSVELTIQNNCALVKANCCDVGNGKITTEIPGPTLHPIEKM